MSLTKTRFGMVQDFNERILGILDRPMMLQTREECKLSVTQLMEEAEELMDARNDLKYVDAIDAVCDSIYFGYGILHKMGIDEDTFNKIFETIHQANMDKKKGVKHNRQGFDAADAAKPEGWVAPELRIQEILKAEARRRVT